MVNWFIIILGIAAVLIVMKLFHLKHLKHKIFGLLIVFLLLFLVGSIYFVSKQNNVDMTTAGGFSKGMQIYAGWLLSSFQNIRTITGYAVGLDWSIANKSISLNNSIFNDTSNVGSKIVNGTSNAVKTIKANTPKLITRYK